MAVIRGDFVQFQIGYEGTMQMCLISQSALLIRERLDERDSNAEIILDLFTKHQVEIERTARAILRTSAETHRYVIITTAEFNS